MNGLLEPLRRVARDLVAKKLWPVAALLLVAVVAVPVYIGSSASDTPAPPATAATAATAAETSSSPAFITAVEPAVTGKDDRPGKVEDPIFDPPKPPATTSSAPATGSTPTGGTGAPASDTPAETTPAETTPAKPAEPAAKPTYYRTVVRWYENTRDKSEPITRLTPLGGLVDTAALYMGVGDGSKGLHAIFLLAPNAISDGEGQCGDENCRMIGLKGGQTRRVTVQPADGSVARQYVLEVVSVRAVTADAAEARTMRAKVHPDGREVMRSMWQDRPTATVLQRFQYDQAKGMLVVAAPTKASE